MCSLQNCETFLNEKKKLIKKITMTKSTVGWKFDNTYSKLPKSLLTKLSPHPVKTPILKLFNQTLSEEIGLDFSEISENEIALIFSGNKLPNGSETIAQAYAGHQFGHFTLLGDGRALIIGEHLTKKKKRIDIQFKGSGRTPYSRNGDGKAAYSPMLREYIISEAMHGLGIPTTRSLAVVKTGETVMRETALEGAMLTRVASSHIRVGTFQYAFLSKDKNDLKILLEYTINRHYPHLNDFKNPAIELLKIVMDKQIKLVTHWMRVGFVHGVMNTDNMTLSGETIDYGPCAFMDRYDPKTVFSSIDYHGRYAYFNQPGITGWNLRRLAESLAPLISHKSDKGVEIASEVLNKFGEKYKAEWLGMMRKKLGLKGEELDDENLIVNLLSWMHINQVDYTNTFNFLTTSNISENKIYNDESFIDWKDQWKKRLQINNNSLEESHKLMRASNPAVIPRNYKVQDALNFASENNDLTKIHDLLKVLKNPYVDNNKLANYQSVPKLGSEKYETFCGT